MASAHVTRWTAAPTALKIKYAAAAIANNGSVAALLASKNASDGAPLSSRHVSTNAMPPTTANSHAPMPLKRGPEVLIGVPIKTNATTINGTAAANIGEEIGVR